MVALISRWKLRNGCPPDLLRALGALTDAVGAHEPGTLMYLVNVGARNPLTPAGAASPPVPIPPAEQDEIVFIESYRDADALSDHVNGTHFTTFLKQNLRFFYEDPDRPGWPQLETTFLAREATFTRSPQPTTPLGDWPAAALLGQVADAIERNDFGRLAALLSEDLVAVVPMASPSGTIGKEQFLSWIESYCAKLGTMRMAPTTVLHGSPHSVGAVVTHTAFNAPPGTDPGDEGRPYWISVPTIAAATTDPAGTKLASLFLITDRPDQKNHQQMTRRILDWFTAYVNQDQRGFLDALAPDLQAYSYNAYTPQPPGAVSKAGYKTGFAEWSAANRKGGFITGEVVAHGSYVGARVQFLTEVKPDQPRLPGQQRMTDEIHVFELDQNLQVRRAFFFETNMCGCPGSPCEW